jgi:hypothetical protein
MKCNDKQKSPEFLGLRYEVGTRVSVLPNNNRCRGRSHGFAAAEVGETGDSEGGEEEGRDKDTDDGDSARHRILEDNDISDEEGKAVEEEQAAGCHCPATRRGAVGLQHPPGHAVDNSENGRQCQNKLPHQQKNDAGGVRMKIGVLWERRVKESWNHHEGQQGKDECGVGETSAQNPEFVHRNSRSPRVRCLRDGCDSIAAITKDVRTEWAYGPVGGTHAAKRWLGGLITSGGFATGAVRQAMTVAKQ